MLINLCLRLQYFTLMFCRFFESADVEWSLKWVVAGGVRLLWLMLTCSGFGGSAKVVEQVFGESFGESRN